MIKANCLNFSCEGVPSLYLILIFNFNIVSLQFMAKCINQIIYSTLMLDTNLKKIQLNLVSSEWLLL